MLCGLLTLSRECFFLILTLSRKTSFLIYSLVRVDNLVGLLMVDASKQDPPGFSHCRKQSNYCSSETLGPCSRDSESLGHYCSRQALSTVIHRYLRAHRSMYLTPASALTRTFLHSGSLKNAVSQHFTAARAFSELCMLLHDGGAQPFGSQSPEDSDIRRLLR